MLHRFDMAAPRHDGVLSRALVTQLLLQGSFQNVDALASRCADRNGRDPIQLSSFTESAPSEITFVIDNDFLLLRKIVSRCVRISRIDLAVISYLKDKISSICHRNRSADTLGFNFVLALSKPGGVYQPDREPFKRYGCLQKIPGSSRRSGHDRPLSPCERVQKA